MMNSPLLVAYNRPNHKQVSIQDSFWGVQMEKIRMVTVWDVIHKFETDYGEGVMKNFEDVAQGLTGTGHHVGPQWYDGLIYEVIRGASDLLGDSYDEKLAEKLEEFIDKIAAAQDKDPDGYLNTYSTLMCPNQRLGKTAVPLCCCMNFTTSAVWWRPAFIIIGQREKISCCPAASKR